MITLAETVRGTQIMKIKNSWLCLISLPLVSSLALVIPSAINDAHAARQYRCNGMVQYHPCDQDLYGERTPQKQNTNITTQKIHYTPPQHTKVMARHQEVLVSEQSFTPISATLGMWKGRVQGAGKIHLHLQIHRNGALESVRYMGNISLNDKSSSFSIRSSIPSGNGWSWRLIGYQG